MELHTFLEAHGFEVLNSQIGKSFGVNPGVHSHTACLDEVDNADYLLLIVGGERGGTFIGSENSITNEEYKRAKKNGIPIIGCVDRGVFNLLPVYKKSPTADFSPTVKDKRVFHFIDFINAGATDNWLHSYASIEEIKNVLTTQFAHFLFSFSRGLRDGKTSKQQDKY
jgi:hypothetical protein